jgi:hypothetical protein
MHDAATSTAAWYAGLPASYAGLTVPPDSFAEHVDEEACARKLNGFDACGRRCWVRHDHTAIELGFDIDEFPLEVAVRHERRTAWRLVSGDWVMTIARIDRLDSCSPRVVNETVVARHEAQLGL